MNADFQTPRLCVCRKSLALLEHRRHRRHYHHHLVCCSITMETHRRSLCVCACALRSNVVLPRFGKHKKESHQVPTSRPVELGVRQGGGAAPGDEGLRRPPERLHLQLAHRRPREVQVRRGREGAPAFRSHRSSGGDLRVIVSLGLLARV